MQHYMVSGNRAAGVNRTRKDSGLFSTAIHQNELGFSLNGWTSFENTAGLSAVIQSVIIMT
jgi:hypothetical protein